MRNKGLARTLMDLEKLNTFNAEGCLACGGKFTLGDPVVLARGKWEGLKYIHEDEAIFDEKMDVPCERGYHGAVKQDLVEEG
jgi:hypothetical protein